MVKTNEKTINKNATIIGIISVIIIYFVLLQHLTRIFHLNILHEVIFLTIVFFVSVGATKQQLLQAEANKTIIEHK